MFFKIDAVLKRLHDAGGEDVSLTFTTDLRGRSLWLHLRLVEGGEKHSLTKAVSYEELSFLQILASDFENTVLETMTVAVEKELQERRRRRAEESGDGS